MDACEVSPTQGAATFQELYDDMQKDAYWIRFFCRPCCPAPKLSGAVEMLDKLAGEVRDNADLDDDQKQQLIGIIEQRKAWYPSSGLCKG